MNALEQWYQRLIASEIDMKPHLPRLRKYAAQCGVVTEFGFWKGNSAVALACGLMDRGGGVLHSYDLAGFDKEIVELWQACQQAGVDFRFHRRSTLELTDLDPCGLLFIDSLHTGPQVKVELKHATSVSQRLAFHDTSLDDPLGAFPSKPCIESYQREITAFLAANAREWTLEAHNPEYYGLTVLRRVTSCFI